MPPLASQDDRPDRDPARPRRGRLDPANSSSSASKPDKLLEVRNLRKHFPIKEGILQRVRSHVRAVDGVSFAIERGRTLGLVGESGCGKTTCGRCVTGIHEPTTGEIEFDGQPTAGLSRRQMGARMQIVFQDPYSSLNPRKTIHQILSDPFRIHMELTEAQIRERVVHLLQRVGLEEEHLDRYPYEFSGGQRQRIAIARAIAVNPAFLFLDEPTSALDVSVQGQILNLLRAIQDEFDLAYLFVTHDIQVVRYMADHVAVMYLGKIMETGPKETIFDDPRHPYTKALFSAVPVPDPESKSARIVLQGETPTPIDPPAGCRFNQRCWAAEPGRCDVDEPALLAPPNAPAAAGRHRVACHFRDQDLRPASGSISLGSA